MSFVARKGCFLCGSLQHLAADCASETRLCFNCQSPDHESTACSEPKSESTKQCYGCGGIGHLQTNCPSLRMGGGFQANAQKCYACGVIGHLARDCPTASTINADGESVPITPIGVIGESATPAQFNGNGFRGRGGFRGGRGGFFRGGRGGARGGAVITSTEPRVCYKCGELNHLARSCTAIIDGEVSGAGPRKNLGPKTCYKCQVLGHIAKDCPEVAEV